MDVRLRLAMRQAHSLCECPREVRMAAMMIVGARPIGDWCRVAARADHVVHAGAVDVKAVPVERVAGDGRHRPQIGQRAPQPIARGQVRGVERARLAAEEALGEIGGVPQVEVADLRPLDAENPKKMAGRNVERAPLAGRDDRLADLRHPRTGVVVECGVVSRQPVDRINDDRFCGATPSGVSGGGVCGERDMRARVAEGPAAGKDRRGGTCHARPVSC